MAEKKQRTCIACRKIKNQDEMIRVSKFGGEIEIDNIKKIGRGAYICKEKQCVELTIKKHLLNRAFKSNLGNEIYQKLEEYEQNN